MNVSEQEKELVKVSKGGNAWKVIPAKRANAQKLSGKEIIELAKLVKHIEKHYKFPCDIEWAREKKKFYITQSRPITTL